MWNTIQEEEIECVKALKCGEASRVPGADEQSGVTGSRHALLGKETGIPRGEKERV